MSSSKPKKSEQPLARLRLAARGMRIGLLGGSFDPPHEAHLEISLTALKRLGLDKVWWLVTPGNPLKDASQLPKLKDRIDAATMMARHPRIEVTGFSGGSAYTIGLLTELKRRFPGVNFVWLMGADNLAEFDRWRAWESIFGIVPIAVLDRPGYRLKGRASKAAQRFSPYMVDESDAAGLALLEPPAWTILTHRMSPLSSTALRAGNAKKEKKSKAKRKKADTKQAKAKAASKTAKRESRGKRNTVKKKATRH